MTAPDGRAVSLRTRLFVLIVVPQFVLAVLASVVLHWMAREMGQEIQPVLPVGQPVDGMALLAQRLLDRAGQHLVVFDQDDPHGLRLGSGDFSLLGGGSAKIQPLNMTQQGETAARSPRQGGKPCDTHRPRTALPAR